MDYKGNADAIETLSRQIQDHRADIAAGAVKVRVLGFCTSQGSRQANLVVAKDRSNQVKSYFIVHEGLVEDNFLTTNSVAAWQGTTDVVAVSYLFPVAALEAQRPVSQPEAPVEEVVMPVPPQAEQPEPPVVEAASVEETVAEPVDVVRAVAPADEEESSFRWAVKTNVAYLAATVANVGVEYAFGDHFSIDFPVMYSPYTVARNYRLRFLAVQPEFRYWLKQPLRGHFFGAHLNIGAFNVSVDTQNRYQSPDGCYGVGISYGYMLPFARHWAAEFTIGAGYVYTRYDTYYNMANGARFEKGVPYNYWGITKVGVSLVYRFGK